MKSRDKLGYPRTVNIGESTLSVFEVGRLTMKLSEYLGKGTRAPEGMAIGSRIDFPIYNAHVAIGENSIMIDPCDYEVLCPVGHSMRPEGYTPPKSLLAQLSLAGFKPEEITHVIMSHFHLDHCIGSTMKVGESKYVPAFPRARYYLGEADWNSAENRADLIGTPEVINSLGVLNQYNLITFVNRETDLMPGVTLLPMPGESPGHQIVRIKSQGATLYCIGDLFHLPMEVADPRIMAFFNNPEMNLRSRISFLNKAAREDAMIFAAHMSLGKIKRTGTGFRWYESY